MVRTGYEIKKETLNEDKIKVIMTIVSGLIHGDFKRLKWISQSSSPLLIDMYAILNQGQVKIFLIGLDSKSNVISSNRLVDTFQCNLSYNNTVKEQTFPVGGVTPKDLGKLAHNIFKWIKEQMKNVPE